jgi:DNA-damage-inducible protein J
MHTPTPGHGEWLLEKLARAANDPRPRIPHQQVMDEAQALIDRKRQARAKASAA